MFLHLKLKLCSPQFFVITEGRHQPDTPPLTLAHVILEAEVSL
jgi:hypothetical protein